MSFPDPDYSGSKISDTLTDTVNRRNVCVLGVMVVSVLLHNLFDLHEQLLSYHIIAVNLWTTADFEAEMFAGMAVVVG